MASSDGVKVCIRVRPFIKRETGSESFWESDTHQIKLKSNKAKSFQFDRVFGDDESTADVYEEIAEPIVQQAMQGFNGTVFAYGQTSSGKTYTMFGENDNLGIIPRAVNDIFNIIEKTPQREYLLRVSYLEIYNENLKDLLATEFVQLQIREDEFKNVKVSGLCEQMVTSPSDVMKLMQKGDKLRRMAATNMNTRSSRSHTIFRLIIESRERLDLDMNKTREGDDTAVMVAQLNMVDLAGSERAGQTGAEGQRLKEGCYINKSLTVLGQVINQICKDSESGSQGNTFISFRDSKLTRILQPSLGGNSLTAIICTATVASTDQTESTLRFASSAKQVKNKPIVNEVLSDEALLYRQKREINQLKKKIQEMERKANMKDIQQENIDQKSLLDERSNLLLEQEEKLNKLKRMLLVSSLPADTANRKQSKLRRETWCPGAMAQPQKPFQWQIPSNQAEFTIMENSTFMEDLDREERSRMMTPSTSKAGFLETTFTRLKKKTSLDEKVLKGNDEVQPSSNEIKLVEEKQEMEYEIRKLKCQLKDQDDLLDDILQKQQITEEQVEAEKREAADTVQSLSNKIVALEKREIERNNRDAYVKSLVGEVDNLKQQLMDACQEKRRLLEQCDVDSEDFRSLSSNMEKLVQETNEKDNELNSYRSQVVSLQSQLEASLSSTKSPDYSSKLEHEIMVLKSELADKTSHYNEILASFEDLQNQMESLKEEHKIELEQNKPADVHEKPKEFIHDISSFVGAGGEKSLLMEDVMFECEMLTAQNKDKKQKLDELMVLDVENKKEIADLKKEFEFLKENNKELKEQIEFDKTEKEILLEEEKNLHSQVTTLQKQLDKENLSGNLKEDYEKEITKLQDQLKTLTDTPNSLLDVKKGSSDDGEKIVELKQESEDAQKLFQDVNMQLSQAHSQIEELNSIIKIDKSTIKALKADLESYEVMSEISGNKRTKSTALEHSIIEQQEETSKEDFETLRNELSEKNLILEVQLEDNKTKFADYNSTIESLQTELESKSQEIENLELNKNQYLLDVENLKVENGKTVEELNNKLNKVNSELELLKQQANAESDKTKTLVSSEKDLKKITELEKDSEDAQNLFQDVNMQLSQAHSQIEELNSIIKTDKSTIKTLKADLESYEVMSEISGNKRTKSTALEHSIIEQQEDTSTEDVDDLKNELLEKNSILENQLEENKKLFEELETKQADYNSAIESLQTKLESKSQEIENLELNKNQYLLDVENLKVENGKIVEDLNNKLNKVNTELNILKEQSHEDKTTNLIKFKEEIQKLNDQLKIKSEEISLLGAKLEEEKTKYLNLQEETAKQIKDIQSSSIENSVMSSQGEDVVAKLREELAERRKQFEELMTENKKLSEDGLHSKGALLAENNKDLNQQRQLDQAGQLQKDVNQTFALERNKANLEIAALQTKLEESKTALAKLQAEKDIASHQLAKENADLKDKVVNLERSSNSDNQMSFFNSRPSMDVHKMEAKIKQLSQKVDLSEQRFFKIETLNKELKEEKKQLQYELSQTFKQNQSFDEINKTLQSKDLKLTELQRELERMRTSFKDAGADAERQKFSMSDKLQEKQNEIDDLLTSKKSCEELIWQYEEKKIALENINSDLKNKQVEQKFSLEQKIEFIENLQAKVSALETELSSVRVNFETSEKEIGEKVNQIAAIEKEINTVNLSFESIKAERDTLVKENEVAKTEVLTLQQQIQNFEAKQLQTENFIEKEQQFAETLLKLETVKNLSLEKDGVIEELKTSKAVAEDLIKSLEKEVLRLQEMLDEKNIEFSDKHNKLEESVIKMQELEQRLKALKSDDQSFIKEELLKNSTEDNNSFSEDKESNLTQLEEEFHQTKVEFERKIKMLETEICEKRRDIDNFQINMQHLQNEISSLKKESKMKDEEYNDAVNSLEVANKKITKLEKDIREAEEEMIKSKREQMEMLEGKDHLSDVEKQFIEVYLQFENLKSSHSALNVEVDQLRNQIEEKNKQLENVISEKQIDSHQTEDVDLIKYQELECRCAMMEKNIVELTEEKTCLQLKLESVDADVQLQDSQIENSCTPSQLTKSVHFDLESEIENVRENRDRLQSEFGDLENEHSILQLKCEELEEKYNSLEAHFEKLHQENEELKIELEHKKNDYEFELENLQSKLKESDSVEVSNRESLDSTEKEKFELQQKLEIKSNDEQIHRQKIISLEEELKQLIEKLAQEKMEGETKVKEIMEQEKCLQTNLADANQTITTLQECNQKLETERNNLIAEISNGEKSNPSDEEQLKQNLLDLEIELNSTKTQICDIENEKNELKTQLKIIESEKAELESQYKVVEIKCDELEEKILSLEKEKEEVAKHFDNKNDEFVAQLEENKIQTEKIVSLEDKLKEFQDKNCEKDKLFDEKILQLEKFQQDLLEKDSVITNITEELKIAQNNEKEINQKIEMLENNCKSKNTECENLAVSNQELKDKLADLPARDCENSHKNCKVEIENLQEDLAVATLKLKRKTDDVEIIKEELNKKELNAAELQSNINDLSQKLKNTEIDFINLQNELESQKSLTDDKQQEIESLSGYKADLEKEILSKESEIKSLHLELTSAQEEVKILTGKITNLKICLDEDRENKLNMIEAKDHLSEVEKNFVTVYYDYQQTLTTNQELTSEVTYLKNNIYDLENMSVVEKDSTKVDELQAEIETEKEKTSQLECDIESLSTKLSKETQKVELSNEKISELKSKVLELEKDVCRAQVSANIPLFEAEEKCRKLENEVQKLKLQVEQQKFQLEEVITLKNTSHEEQVLQLKKKCSSLENELALKAQIIEETKLEATTKSRENNAERVKEWKRVNLILCEEKEGLMEQLKNKEEKIVEITLNTENLKMISEKLQTQLNSINQEFQNEKKSLNEKYDQLSKTSSEYLTKNLEYKKKLAELTHAATNKENREKVLSDSSNTEGSLQHSKQEENKLKEALCQSTKKLREKTKLSQVLQEKVTKLESELRKILSINETNQEIIDQMKIEIRNLKQKQAPQDTTQMLKDLEYLNKKDKENNSEIARLENWLKTYDTEIENYKSTIEQLEEKIKDLKKNVKSDKKDLNGDDQASYLLQIKTLRHKLEEKESALLKIKEQLHLQESQKTENAQPLMNTRSRSVAKGGIVQLTKLDIQEKEMHQLKVTLQKTEAQLAIYKDIEVKRRAENIDLLDENNKFRRHLRKLTAKQGKSEKTKPSTTSKIESSVDAASIKVEPSSKPKLISPTLKRQADQQPTTSAAKQQSVGQPSYSAGTSRQSVKKETSLPDKTIKKEPAESKANLPKKTATFSILDNTTNDPDEITKDTCKTQ